jgi:hypothetical protein
MPISGLPENFASRLMKRGNRTGQPASAMVNANFEAAGLPGASPANCSGVWSARGARRCTAPGCVAARAAVPRPSRRRGLAKAPGRYDTPRFPPPCGSASEPKRSSAPGTSGSTAPIFSRNRFRLAAIEASYHSRDENSRCQCRCRVSTDWAILRSTKRCAPSIVPTERSSFQVSGPAHGSTAV